ncbi:MAG: preprotein translocase subunit SecB [Oleiphilaceae bacterium]|jgi:preprotein translocase subunit SecB
MPKSSISLLFITNIFIGTMMADNEAPSESTQKNQEQGQAGFALQRIYVKDLSFESPNSPQVFQKQWKPEVKMDLSTKHKLVAENLYEVVISVTLTVSVEDMTAYIVEVQQAGIFAVQGIEGAQLAQALNAFCPNLLFPYLRETIDTTVIKGSFPAIMLAPVNFDAIFSQAMIQKQKEAAEQSGESTDH